MANINSGGMAYTYASQPMAKSSPPEVDFYFYELRFENNFPKFFTEMRLDYMGQDSYPKCHWVSEDYCIVSYYSRIKDDEDIKKMLTSFLRSKIKEKIKIHQESLNNIRNNYSSLLRQDKLKRILDENRM